MYSRAASKNPIPQQNYDPSAHLQANNSINIHLTQ